MIMDRNEAISIVRKNLVYDRHQLSEALETLIPELKESEDDGIRKQILDCFRTMKQYDSWIAWLEKQGKTALEAINEVKVDNQNCVKNNDKVEPKFKIGDWIIADEVHQDYRICQIIDIKDNKYFIESIEGYKGFNYFDAFEKLYHLWTIQDAKDGDVLIDHCDDYKNPLIFILKKFETVDFGLAKKSDYSSYCFLSMGDKPRFKEGRFHHMNDIKPATKEQRDLLLQKMEESGYEWDAEKKKLRKIEQTPDWSEEDKNFMHDTLSNLTELKDRYGEGYGNVGKCIDWLKSLKYRYTWKPSDKQMEQLGWIAEQNKDNMIGKDFITLYNDLKKVK